MSTQAADIAAIPKPGGRLGAAALAAYGVAGSLCEPLAGALLARRGTRSADHARDDLAERLGRASRVRPAGALVWVHASSIGETVIALPIIERLVGRGLSVVLTTAAASAAEIAGKRLPPGAIHQYSLIDTPGAVNRFLDHWRPGLAIFTESELWPTRLDCLARRAIPLAVVNARLSERSFGAWRRVAPIARAIVGKVDLALARSPGDAARLRALGAKSVRICGDLKFDAPPPPADEAELRHMRECVGHRFVLLAASTHRGEEGAITAAHTALAGRAAKPLTIVAPRHPRRADEIAAAVAGAGLSVRRRSRGEAIAADTDIYLADTIGELGLWYRIADAAFLGGSLVPSGGHNPIEAAKLGTPVLHGPHVGNFEEAYRALDAVDAAIPVADGAALAAAVRDLASEPGKGARMADAASACIEEFTGALERTMNALDPYLVRADGPSCG